MGETNARGRVEVTHEDVHAGEHGARARCLPEPWMCAVFHLDGSLRDIRVLGTTRVEWIAVLERLRAVADETEVEHSSPRVDPLRPAVADLFRVWADEPEGQESEGQESGFSFRARFGSVWFFAMPCFEEEIEFSVRPEGVLDGAGVAAVLRFLVEVATASQRRALLTGETVRYDPGMPTLISHDPVSGLTSHI
ncbi:hypothetical protein OHS33_34775 [Streptomyces sp. NBC_00536]|uniref:hypothetical protein n=1 Tax=Streptomyces sp. NBC_00536 TaxID=2975769 RepID=UPI002E80041F|nr:hypothetical protein [Streptomyces sp. NBC_00536]WUC83083.1 hypothetical protein OHS33_34775 [Streptomyces sp. NBC_00536]